MMGPSNRFPREPRSGDGKDQEAHDGAGPREFEPAGDPGDDPLTRNLKKVYDEVAAEPIPEEWLKLLDMLDSKPGEMPGD